VKRRLLGPHAVLEALRAAPGRVAVVYTGEGARAAPEVADAARRAGVPVEARAHQGVVAIAGDYPYLDLPQLLARCERPALVVALDGITDPHNLGAICRSVSAFGGDGLVVTERRAAPVTAATVRVSAGATEHLALARVTNLVRALKAMGEQGLQIVGLASEGPVEIHALPFPPDGRVLVVGAEGAGLRRLVREHCDVLARIALRGPIGSLNASVAAGIAAYESARQRAALRARET
jgi:23S rRNA (guanosine2251-2'-O)-methyltransferase